MNLWNNLFSFLFCFSLKIYQILYEKGKGVIAAKEA